MLYALYASHQYSEFLWHEECRREAEEMAHDEWAACQPEDNASPWPSLEEQEECYESLRWWDKIYAWQKKWDARPLPHHAYAPAWMRAYDFPTDDDIPF